MTILKIIGILAFRKYLGKNKEIFNNISLIHSVLLN